MAIRLVFLGTGAAGGTPGRGRTRRRESSILVRDASSSVVIDATRDVESQLRLVEHIDAVLLTHAHRDASGGLPALRSWSRRRRIGSVRVLAHPATIAALESRYRQLDHCRFDPTLPGARRRLGPLTVDALEVPHAREPDVPTYAWRFRAHGLKIVYASDVAHLTPELETFTRGADALIVDGATWRRRIFTHLRIDEDLPRLCAWPIGRIFLTQIGRSAPPHEKLARTVTQLCARARPAHDGLEVRV